MQRRLSDKGVWFLSTGQLQLLMILSSRATLFDTDAQRLQLTQRIYK